jgi:predicted nucleic acid-binding protein
LLPWQRDYLEKKADIPAWHHRAPQGRPGMNVVDSSAWLAYFAGNPSAEELALAIQAARLSADMKLPLSDSIILATARRHAAVLWTQDADFKGMEGVQFREP